MASIRAFVLDWDGVFNDSRKTGQSESYFTEVDSMGTNLLRYSSWLKNKNTLPFTAVISGEQNNAAKFFLQREHFHTGYFMAKDKLVAFRHFCEEHQLKPKEVAFVFDDVLDLSLAQIAGMRICIHHNANPAFNDFVIKNKLADYVTGNTSGNFALREACELMISANGNAERVFSSRMKNDADYQSYIQERNTPRTVLLEVKNEKLKPLQ